MLKCTSLHITQVPVGKCFHSLTLLLLMEYPLVEKTVNMYSAHSISPIISEKTYFVVLTRTTFGIKLLSLEMETTKDSSSPLRENGSFHVATRLKPATLMFRSTGGFGSAINKERMSSYIVYE